MKYLFCFFLLIGALNIQAQTYSQKDDRFHGPWSTDYNDFGIINKYLKSINLDENTDAEILTNKVLSFSRTDQSRVIWGVGKAIDAVFDYDYLPVFFERELVFEDLDLETGIVKWVFTGNEGGWTVQISKNEINLYQRFYDSFGFYQPENILSKGTEQPVKNYRHSNKIWLVSTIKTKGKLKTIKVKTDYTYKLILEANGKEIARQDTRIDISRQQLQFTDGIKKVSGTIYKPAVKKAKITIDASIKYQKILGFGGIMSIPAYNELSEKGKKMWWEIMKDYNLLIQREYPVGQMLNENYDNWDDIQAASPHYYGDNFPNGEISNFEFNKQIIDAGGMITFSFWKLPAAFINDDETVNTQEYTKAIIKYCKTLKEKSGAYPIFIGVQNEIAKPPEDWYNMTIALRKALDKNGMKEVKIMMFNSPFVYGGIKAAKAFKENENVWKTIDYAASNMYDYNNILRTPDRYDSSLYVLKKIIGDKPFISSELAINWNDYQTHSYRTAFSMARLYHKNMTILNAVSLQYCWTILNSPQESFDLTRTLAE